MQSELSFDAVLTAYGLTEAVVATMCRTDDDPVTVATTSGRADPPASRSGSATRARSCCAAPNVMLGYLDDPEATAKAIDADGWLHTGDVGSLDERGYLDITDRLKDMYICGGFNVYPAEVEQAARPARRGRRVGRHRRARRADGRGRARRTSCPADGAGSPKTR